MPFVTGNAASLADVLTAVRNACTANGWTLSGNVLHKSGCYVLMDMQTCPAPATRPSIGTRQYLRITAGNGIDGSNNLTDAAGISACVGPGVDNGNSSTLAYLDWAFPVTYSIHINTAPDEVWVAIQYNGVYFQHIGFGKSPAPGNPGTGNWFYATFGQAAYTDSNHIYKTLVGRIAHGDGYNVGIGAFQAGYVLPQPFWIYNTSGNTLDTAGVGLQNYSFHSLHGSTGAAAWAATGQGFTSQLPVGAIGGIAASPAIYDLYNKQPNNWNNESILLPCQLMKRRPGSKTSIVGHVQHMRYVKMQNLDINQILDKSPDKWRVYPVYLRSTANPNTASNVSDTGCHGIAIRYDGV